MLLKDISAQTRAILRYTPPSLKRGIGVILAFTIFAGFLELSVAGLVSLLGVALATPQSVLETPVLRDLLALSPSLMALLADQAVLLGAILLLVVLGVFCKNVLLAVLTYKQSYLGYALSAAMGGRLFETYLSKNYLWHLEQNSGELLTDFNFRAYVSVYVIHLLTMVTQLTISLALLLGGLAIAPLPTAVVLGLTGIASAFSYKVSRRAMQQHNVTIINVTTNLNKNVLAGLHGIRDMRIYQREAAIALRVNQGLNATLRESAVTTTLPSLPVWALESVGMLTLLLALLLMVMLDFSMAKITGSLALLAAMAWRLLPCMNRAVASIVTMQGNTPYIKRFFRAFEGVEQGAPLDPQEPLPFEKSIDLHEITFSYPKATRAALNAVSFSLPKGSMLGIIGTSGAGKSTLMGLMTGLLTPDSGRLLVDGAEVTEQNSGGLRALIGYVPQTPYLLDASLAENIAFSRWGEPVNEARVLEVCRMAAVDFWEQLAEGIYTEIGERGVRLSGGQAQRVAIARALYSDPQILLFDEATSALDMQNEKAILETIFSLRNQATLIMIAHRLSTVERCDNLVWLENGQVRMSGVTGEILANYQTTLQTALAEVPAPVKENCS